MKRLIAFIAILGLISTHLFAQNPIHQCGFDHLIRQMDQTYPGYKHRIDQVFEQALRQGQEQLGTRSVVTIPVAVHVVWKELEECLSECTITEQIDVIKEDYRRQNADTANLRPIFGSIAADTEIDFRLDTIIWTQSNVDFATLGPFGGLIPDPTSLDSVKGASPALDPNQYLNIWILNLGSGGLLGYAYPPDSLPNWPAGVAAPSPDKEGVVLHYEIVGRSKSITIGSIFGGSTTIQTEGRTATHEVGHYLGLRHIWGDGGGIFGGNSCGADDGIFDTPNTIGQSQFDCDTTKNTCVDSATIDWPDMIENYMDYSAESCMNTFTVGQKNLMQGVLSGPRVGLTTTPVKVRPTNDAFLAAQTLTIVPTCSGSGEPATTTGASISLPYATGCNTQIHNDIWFQFTAVDSTIDLTISNVSITAGNSSILGYELFSGQCDSLVSISCGTDLASSFNNLNTNETYYLRVYSDTSSSSQDFDICLSAPLTNTRKLLAQNSLAIYPNPSNGDITVELTSGFAIEGVLQVRNLLGQSLSNQIVMDVNNKQVQISLQDQPNGIYVVELLLDSGQSISKKVLLQR